MRDFTPDLVSTIIPVYNRDLQLREAVESVISQDYRPIELIIVDDGSTDDTLSIARSLAAQYPELVRVTGQINGGPGLAREHGRQLARGEFVQYLDSDDVLLPGKFSSQVKALRSRPDADVAYGITLLRTSKGVLVPEAHKWTGRNVATMFPGFLVNRWWETATPLYRASVCERAGPWTDLRLEEDWEYDCRIAALGGRLVWCDQPVSEHRDHWGDRLSRGSGLDAARLLPRARSHELVLGHAFRAGLAGSVEMQRYARELFLLSRQCGAANLVVWSRRLFELSRSASGAERARGMDFRLYRAVCAVLGWRVCGSISCWADRFRG